LSGSLRAELRKITTTRLWWVVLISILVLSGGYAAGVALLQPGAGGAAFADPGVVRSVYNGGNPVARVLALVLGIATMGAEYRHQTLAATYLATPRRSRVLVGKALSLLLFGLLYGVASVLAGVAVAAPFVLVDDGSFFFDRGDTWRSLVLGVGSLALWTMLGMGIGILVRNLLVAMLVGISFAYLVEPILALVAFLRGWDLVLNLLPTGATNAMLGITSPVLFASDQPFAWWQGGLILAAWCLLPPLVAVLSTVRRDVT
jgi:ABC-type transport system involved in multi-copper enzyme maturation permease subunit